MRKCSGIPTVLEFYLVLVLTVLCPKQARPSDPLFGSVCVCLYRSLTCRLVLAWWPLALAALRRWSLSRGRKKEQQKTVGFFEVCSWCVFSWNSSGRCTGLIPRCWACQFVRRNTNETWLFLCVPRASIYSIYGTERELSDWALSRSPPTPSPHPARPSLFLSPSVIAPPFASSEQWRCVLSTSK